MAQQMLYLEGERFIKERYLVKSLVSKGMTIVDIGANIGYYLLMLESVIGENGKIYCIEPSQENLPELKRNIKQNKLDNVELIEAAVGSQKGTVGMKSGINAGVTDADHAPYQVEVDTLGALVSTSIDFIKIDVEGEELLIPLDPNSSVVS